LKDKSDLIKQHIDQYLKNGGKITICPPQTYASDADATVRRTYRTRANKND